MTTTARLEILVIAGCPHTDPAYALAAQTVASLGLGEQPVIRVVNSADEAARLRFRGSPSFHLDGSDLFDGPSLWSLSCRLYPGSDGSLRGLPTEAELSRVLKARW